MDDRRASESGSDQCKSDSKSGSVEKRDGAEYGSESRKRVKTRDLESVCRFKGMDTHQHKSLKDEESSAEHHLGENDDPEAEKVIPNTFSLEGNEKPRPLDLNTEMFLLKDKNPESSQECSKSSEKSDNDFGKRGVGLDLNSEDVSSSMNQDEFFPYKQLKALKKTRDMSECASSTGPLEENDSLRMWNEMKQNGFLSSTHGGIPIPKQRGRKSKTDVFKKKMEIAKKEQVDRFTKIAAPSGLLNDLNPGIINHVRNRKQVHSIIEALVRSEKHETGHIGNKHASHSKSDAAEISSINSAMHLTRQESQPHVVSWVSQAQEFQPSLVKCPSILEDNAVKKQSTTQSSLATEEDALTLKLSSSPKISENKSSLSNNDSASCLSVKAATIASQWLDLLHQDIKGRLSALRRSKKKVRAVISTELPFLLSKEFTYDQENYPSAMQASASGFSHGATAELHRTRWNKLFDQMDKSLSDEEKHLENWLNQVKEMQLHCEQGLRHVYGTTPFGIQQLGTSDSDPRAQKVDSLERDSAVQAAAASIYSTCNFLLKENNISCF